MTESATFTITRIGWDSEGVLYVCWSGGGCYWWPAAITEGADHDDA